MGVATPRPRPLTAQRSAPPLPTQAGPVRLVPPSLPPTFQHPLLFFLNLQATCQTLCSKESQLGALSPRVVKSGGVGNRMIKVPDLPLHSHPQDFSSAPHLGRKLPPPLNPRSLSLTDR